MHQLKKEDQELLEYVIQEKICPLRIYPKEIFIYSFNNKLEIEDITYAKLIPEIVKSCYNLNNVNNYFFGLKGYLHSEYVNKIDSSNDKRYLPYKSENSILMIPELCIDRETPIENKLPLLIDEKNKIYYASSIDPEYFEIEKCIENFNKTGLNNKYKMYSIDFLN